MSAIFTALVAAFAVIALGALMSARNWMSRDMWSGLEHVAYYVLFPALIVNSLAGADMSAAPVGGLVAVFICAIIVMCAIVFALRPVFLGPLGLSGPQFSSVFQGAIRWHTFLALAIVASAYGPDGVVLAAIAIAAIVPLANVLSVLVVTTHTGRGLPGPMALAKTLFTNPFLLSSVGGSLLNVSGIELGTTLTGILDLLGQGATGIGLLVVGGGLKLRATQKAKGGVAIAVILKLLIMPALVFVAALYWGVGGLALEVALIAGAVPTATGSYILARQLGGDGEYVAGILTIQLLASALTIPAILWLARISTG